MTGASIIACIIIIIIDEGGVLASSHTISVAYFLARALRYPSQISPTTSCLMHSSQPDDDEDAAADDDDGEHCLRSGMSSS